MAKGGGISPLHSRSRSGGQVTTGGCVSNIVMTCWHCPVLSHESAIVYVLVIVLGQVPPSVSVTVNVASSIPQLSVTVPPPAKNSVNEAKAGGIAPLHSKFAPGGQVITGLLVSSIVIICMHSAVLSQESAME